MGIKPGGGSGSTAATPVLTLIQSQDILVANKTASVTFSSIPQSVRELRFSLALQTDRSGIDNEDLHMSFNGDSGSNYLTTAGDGTVSTGKTTFAYIGTPGAATAQAGQSFHEIMIKNYAQAVIGQAWIFECWQTHTLTNSQKLSGGGVYLPAVPVAITSVTFVTKNAANMWGQFELYGVS